MKPDEIQVSRDLIDLYIDGLHNLRLREKCWDRNPQTYEECLTVSQEASAVIQKTQGSAAKVSHNIQSIWQGAKPGLVDQTGWSTLVHPEGLSALGPCYQCGGPHFQNNCPLSTFRPRRFSGRRASGAPGTFPYRGTSRGRSRGGRAPRNRFSYRKDWDPHRTARRGTPRGGPFHKFRGRRGSARQTIRKVSHLGLEDEPAEVKEESSPWEQKEESGNS